MFSMLYKSDDEWREAATCQPRARFPSALIHYTTFSLQLSRLEMCFSSGHGSDKLSRRLESQRERDIEMFDSLNSSDGGGRTNCQMSTENSISVNINSSTFSLHVWKCDLLRGMTQQRILCKRKTDFYREIWKLWKRTSRLPSSVNPGQYFCQHQ